MGLSIGGLMSGYNTDDWVQKLISAESVPITAETNRKMALATKQASWKNIRTSLEALRSALDGLRLSTNYKARSITSSDETVATATVTTGATAASHTLTVASLAKAQMVAGTSTMTASDTALGLSGTIKIGIGTDPTAWKDVTIATTDSLTAIKNKINESGANVTADLIKVTNGATTSYQINLTSNLKGTANAIHLADDAVTHLLQDPKLQLLDGTGAFITELTAASNAVFTLDNSNFSTSSNDVTDALTGVSFTLKDAGTTTLTIDPDNSKLVSAVQDWVNAVNNTIGVLDKEGKNDPDNKSFGALAGDSLVRSIRTKLKDTVSAVVPGLPSTMNQLSQIGVTTGAYGTDDYGKILFDSQKLTDQLKTDPDSVARLFGELQDVSASGIATDMYSYVNGTLLKTDTGSLDARDATLTEQVKRIDDRISSMNDKLKTRETQLRMQFYRMEQAVGQFQNQGSALYTQFFSGK